MKKFIIGLIVLLLVLVIGFGGVYEYMKLNMDPKKSYMQGVLEFVQASESLDLGPLSEIDKVAKESPVEVDTTVNIPIKNGDLKDALSELGIESPIEVSAKSIVDAVDFASNESITVKTGKEDKFFDASLIVRTDAIGVKVDGVDDKYIALKNEDLKEFAKNLGIDDEETLELIPDKIPLDAFSMEEIDKIKEDFTQFVTNTLNEYEKDSYSVEKFEEDFGSEFGVKSGKKYTFTIPKKDIVSKAKTYVKNFLDNDNLLGDIKALIPDEYMDDLKEEIDDLGKDIDDKNVKITLYKSSDGVYKLVIIDDSNVEYYNSTIDKAKSISCQKLTTNAEYDKDGKINSPASTVEMITKNDGKSVSVSSKLSYNQDNVKTIISDRKNSTKSYYDDDTDSYTSEFTFDTEEDEEDDDDNNYYEEYYKDLYKDRGYSFEISYEGKDGEYTGDITFNVDDFLNEDDFDEEEYKEVKSVLDNITISYSSKKVSKSDIISLDESNSKFVNDYKEEDFTKLLEDIVQNMKEYAEENETSAIALISGYMDGLYGEDNEDNEDGDDHEWDIEDLEVDEDEENVDEDEEEEEADEEEEEL